MKACQWRSPNSVMSPNQFATATILGQSINRHNSGGLAREAIETGKSLTCNLVATSVMIWDHLSASDYPHLVLTGKGVKKMQIIMRAKFWRSPWFVEHWSTTKKRKCTSQQNAAVAHKVMKTGWYRTHLSDFIAANEWPNERMTQCDGLRCKGHLEADSFCLEAHKCWVPHAFSEESERNSSDYSAGRSEGVLLNVCEP